MKGGGGEKACYLIYLSDIYIFFPFFSREKNVKSPGALFDIPPPGPPTHHLRHIIHHSSNPPVRFSSSSSS